LDSSREHRPRLVVGYEWQDGARYVADRIWCFVDRIVTWPERWRDPVMGGIESVIIDALIPLGNAHFPFPLLSRSACFRPLYQERHVSPRKRCPAKSHRAGQAEPAKVKCPQTSSPPRDQPADDEDLNLNGRSTSTPTYAHVCVPRSGLRRHAAESALATGLPRTIRRFGATSATWRHSTVGGECELSPRSPWNRRPSTGSVFALLGIGVASRSIGGGGPANVPLRAPLGQGPTARFLSSGSQGCTHTALLRPSFRSPDFDHGLCAPTTGSGDADPLCGSHVQPLQRLFEQMKRQ